MRKIISVLLFTVMIFFSIYPLAAATSVYTVSFNIHFIENLLFSTYDVAMYLNNSELIVLPHGTDFTGDFNVEAGQYTISFFKYYKNKKDEKVKGTIDLTIDGNTEISCTISCYSEKVETRDVTVKTLDSEAVTDATDVIPVNTPAPTPVVDHHDEALEGHGYGFRAGEPDYIGIIGYVVVYGDQEREIEQSGDIENKELWEVSTFEQDKQFWNEAGKLLHKTEVVVRDQMLSHRSYGNYSGYLLVEKIDDGTMHYIDVKNFETKPYWTYQDKMLEAAKLGIFLAEFKQVSDYYPVYNDGRKAEVKDGTIVLVTGTAGLSKNYKKGNDIEGVCFVKKNKKSKRTLYFNPADLTIIY